ncbi:hypothetical protein MRX96_009135 [Rhipicephalus microplus]
MRDFDEGEPLNDAALTWFGHALPASIAPHHQAPLAPTAIPRSSLLSTSPSRRRSHRSLAARFARNHFCSACAGRRKRESWREAAAAAPVCRAAERSGRRASQQFACDSRRSGLPLVICWHQVCVRDLVTALCQRRVLSGGDRQQWPTPCCRRQERECGGRDGADAEAPCSGCCAAPLGCSLLGSVIDRRHRATHFRALRFDLACGVSSPVPKGRPVDNTPRTNRGTRGEPWYVPALRCHSLFG